MEKNTKAFTTWSIEVKWGLILGAISFALFLTLALSGSQTESGLSWLGIVPTIGIFILAHREFKNLGDGTMNYGKGVGIATLTSVISSTTSSLCNYIYIKFIDTDYLKVMRQEQVKMMQEEGMKDQEAEAFLAIIDAFMTPGFIALVGVIGGVFSGFILSLIVSIFTKNSSTQ